MPPFPLVIPPLPCLDLSRVGSNLNLSLISTRYEGIRVHENTERRTRVFFRNVDQPGKLEKLALTRSLFQLSLSLQLVSAPSTATGPSGSRPRSRQPPCAPRPRPCTALRAEQLSPLSCSPSTRRPRPRPSASRGGAREERAAAVTRILSTPSRPSSRLSPASPAPRSCWWFPPRTQPQQQGLALRKPSPRSRSRSPSSGAAPPSRRSPRTRARSTPAPRSTSPPSRSGLLKFSKQHHGLRPSVGEGRLCATALDGLFFF